MYDARNEVVIRLYDHALKVLRHEGGIGFCLISASDSNEGLTFFLPQGFRNDGEREAAQVFLRHALRENNVRSYGLLMEAWLASYDRHHAQPGHKDYRPPRSRDDRRECIVIAVVSDQPAIVRCWIIERGETSKDVTLVEDASFAKMDASKFESPWLHLLD